MAREKMMRTGPIQHRFALSEKEIKEYEKKEKERQKKKSKKAK